MIHVSILEHVQQRVATVVGMRRGTIATILSPVVGETTALRATCPAHVG